MAINIDKNGTIFIHQGDSGEVVVSGINTDKDYSVYFAVKNSKRETIGTELVTNSANKSFVTFNLTSDFTDLLTVSPQEDFEIYHYGIKLCYGNSIEDTLNVVNKTFGQLNNIVVYPKIVEGV